MGGVVVVVVWGLRTGRYLWKPHPPPLTPPLLWCNPLHLARWKKKPMGEALFRELILYTDPPPPPYSERGVRWDRQRRDTL